MKTVIGTLNYFGWFKQWNLISPTCAANLNIKPHFENVFSSLKGKNSSVSFPRDGIIIKGDDSSGKILNYETGIDFCRLDLKAVKGVGYRNLLARVDALLITINGRKISMEFNNQSIGIKAIDNNNIFRVMPINDYSCAIPAGKEKEICGFGQNDSCIFCSRSNGQFLCEKFNFVVVKTLLNYLADKHITGKIGSCGLLNPYHQE